MNHKGAGALVHQYLEAIRQQGKTALQAGDQHYEGELALWAFLYYESADMLVHWELLHPQPTHAQNGFVKAARIFAGDGTIGFVRQTGEPEIVADTFADPRGRVAVEDAIIGNHSWCGIPILDADRKVKAIVSFFPLTSAGGPARWNGEIEEIRNRLAAAVVPPTEGGPHQLMPGLLLSEYERARRENEVLVKFWETERCLDDTVERFLNQTVELGAPLCLLPRVHLFLRNQDGALTCPSPKYFRMDLNRERRKVLQELQWLAVTGKDALQSDCGVRLGQLAEAARVRLMVDRDNADQLFVQIHTMRSPNEREANEIASAWERVFEPWKKIFEAIFTKCREEHSTLDDRKIAREALAGLFGTFIQAMLRHDGDSDLQASALAALRGFLQERFRLREEWPEIGKLPKTPLAEICEAVTAVSLWKGVADWQIVSYEPFAMEEKLRRPGNWKVLQYWARNAEANIEYKPDKKYRPIDWPAATFALERTRDELIFSANEPDMFARLKSCDRFLFPIDLQLVPSAYHRYRFEHDKVGELALRIEGDEVDDSGASPYRVLASDPHDNRAAIVLGPLPDGEEAGEPGAALREFARKGLELVLLQESRDRIEAVSRKAAATAILVESYAHNVASHGLAGLRRFVDEQWHQLKPAAQSRLEAAESLAATLAPAALAGLVRTHAQLPEFIRNLQEKSAFWNAATRGGPRYGGEHVTVWDLVDTFARNNLFCGSLVKSEGLPGVAFVLHIGGQEHALGVVTQRIDGRYRQAEERLTNGDGERRTAYETRLSASELDNTAAKSYPGAAERCSYNLTQWPWHVFLPEGSVGRQAVYTIWENVIRNVKHCDIEALKSVPLSFHIEIEDDGQDLCQVKAWLDAPSKKRDDGADAVVAAQSAMEDWRGLLNPGGQPVMGGISQNVLCATMLAGLTFDEAERAHQEGHEWLGGLKPMRFEVLNCCAPCDRKRLAYAFSLWKGQDFVVVDDVDGWHVKGPPGRYRIIVVPDSATREEINATGAAVRCVVVEDSERRLELANPKDDKLRKRQFAELYRSWVNEFVIGAVKRPGIKVLAPPSGAGSWRSIVELKGVQNNSWQSFALFHGTEAPPAGTIPLPHKSHTFANRYIYASTANGAGPADLALACELGEVLGLRIAVWDKRLFDASEELGKPNDLGIWVFDERAGLDAGCQQIAEIRVHFAVVHLSLLETELGGRDHEAVAQVFTNRAAGAKWLREKACYVVVTTGRGRDPLLGLDPSVRVRTRYVPIENLISCFEDARQLEPASPHLGAKYALVKALMGS